MSNSILGSRRTTEAVQKWKISIPEQLAVELELILLDPAYRRPVYGLRSQVLSELLALWLSDCKKRLSEGKPILLPGPQSGYKLSTLEELTHEAHL